MSELFEGITKDRYYKVYFYNGKDFETLIELIEKDKTNAIYQATLLLPKMSKIRKENLRVIIEED
jgi:hypothetical protein